MTYKTFHKAKYYIAFKHGFDDCKKDITVTIDKFFVNDCLKISLSDDEDPTFLYVMSVTRSDYEDLKTQQGLLIDFDNFPSQLVRLLQQCASNNMFLILQQRSPIEYNLEIIEHNEFKRLVHLSLKTTPATDAEIKQHMADTINNLKKSFISLKSTSSSTEALLKDKCIELERKVHDLMHTVTKVEEDKLRRETEFQETMKKERDRLLQERLNWQKNIEMNTQVQYASSQECLNKKEKQIEELHSLCKQLRDNISHLENQLSEKSQRLNVLEAEVQKTHIEVATLKHKNVSLERETLDKEKQYNQLNSRYQQLEKTLQESSETIKDLNSSLNLAKKEKTSLEERLALSESLAKKNNEGAHSTSEQLMKANQIISKQNADLMEMKEKLLCRTAIALEQEKVIERNTKEIEDLKGEVSDTKQNLDKIKGELENLKEKYESCEKSLKDRDETIRNNNMVIQWLHKKLEINTVENNRVEESWNNIHQNPSCGTSSTPHFSHKNNQTATGLSDESINFYESSKLSNIEVSPQQAVSERSTKVGLDPKYLRPAVVKVKDTARTKSVDLLSQRGKENKNIELPKVDYREKKSTRSTTYRSTPVSAYFP